MKLNNRIIRKYAFFISSFLFALFFLKCGGYITEGTIEPEDNFEDREYEFYVPSSQTPDNPLPIMFVFHGSGSSPWSTRIATKFNEYAEENNIIVVYPRGIDGYWNCDDKCSKSYGDNQNDIGFVDYLINKFDQEYTIDRERIYACGFSLGAMFTMSLALERSNVFAAVASVAGNMTISAREKFSGAGKMPVMILHGMLDNLVSWEGGGTGDCERKPIYDLVKRWAEHNGCSNNPTVEDLPDTGEDYIHVVKETYDNCSGNAETILYKIEGGIHEWFTFEEFKASEAILEFFLRHSR